MAIFNGVTMLTKNTHICLINCEMSALCVMKLASLVDSILSNKYVPLPDVGVQFFSYVGSKRSVVKVYDENINSWVPFEKNNEGDIKYFTEASVEDFLSSKRRIFLFEVHSFDLSSKLSVSNQIDTVNLEHICLLSRKLMKLGEDFYFFISGIPTDNQRYTFVSDSDFHRARTFLFLETMYGYINRIQVLADFSGKWISFYAPDIVAQISNPEQRAITILNDSRFGKILPLIDINKQTYMCFHKRAFYSNSYQSSDLLEKRIRELAYCYTSRLQKKFSVDERMLLNDMLKLDNLFEAIVFLSTLYYYDEDDSITLSEIEQLHENCVDYSQGIFQLIENSFYHVITESKLGWGNVAFRIREIKSDGDLLHKYEYEIHLNDLSGLTTKPVGIVNNFVYNFPTLRDADIKLQDIFKYNRNEKLSAFLEDDVNIAHHYGLMILNNAVLSHNGFIHVRSADSVYFSDDPHVEKDHALPWINGTSYKIKLPISLDKPFFNHWDNIALDNPDMHGGKLATRELISKELLNLSTCYYSSQDKVSCINKLHTLLCHSSFNKDTVYLINCSGINSETECEVLAKTVFLLLSSPNEFEKVAFINLESKYSVIKLFRQFALFYNRKGENHTLSNKGVFFVDKEAKLSLLLLGHIVDIINEIYALELTGEVDETAVTIINSLGRRINGS